MLPEPSIRSRRRELAFVLALLVTLFSITPVAAASKTPRPPDTLDDRFEPYAFIGEVNNRFAAGDRVLDPEAEDDDRKFIDHVAGFGFDYRLLGGAASPLQLVVAGQTIHSARAIVVDDTTGGVATPNPDDFLTVLRDGSTLETLASVRIRRALHWLQDGSDTVIATALFLKAQGGFIRTDVRGDDVLDSHFVGFGIEHLVGRYRDSFLEVGYGRTEIFERDRRDDRFKIGASLNYTPGADIEPGESGEEDEALPVGFFAEFWFDSDLGPGSDDIQLYLGLFFDVDGILDRMGSRRSGS